MIVSFPTFFSKRLWLLIGISILMVQAAAGQWLTGYKFRKEITIPDASITGGPHVDFPVLIDLSGDADVIAHATSASGFDIAFTDTDEFTLLNFEVFTDDRADYRAFVKVTLPATGDKVIYVYYGNTSVTADPSTTATWNSAYQAVLHLQEAGVGDDDEFPDATSNGYDGTGGGSLGAGDGSRTPVRMSGKFGYAQQFDGTDDRIRLRPLDETNPGPTWTAVTVQAWVNISTAQDAALFGKTWGTTTSDQTWLLQATPSNLGTRMQSNTANSEFNPLAYSTGTWYHAVATWDASDNQLRVYINGVEQTPSTGLAGTQIYSTSIPAQGQLPTIGNIPATYGNRALNGLIQETRVANTALTSSWIKTEYDNQNNPAVFISKNPEERYPDASLGVVAAENPICSGRSTFIIVSNSEIGINYQLRNNADDTPIGSPVAGSGNAIYLPTGNLTANTTFNVLATNDAGSASVELSTTPSVTINPNPTATLISDKDGVSNVICAGETVVFTASGGTIYEFFVNGFGVQGPGASDIYSTGSLDDGDAVIVEVTDGNGCSAVSTPINMTVNPLPDALAIPNNDQICSESAINITLSNPNGVGALFTWSVVQTGVSGGNNQVIPASGPITDVLTTTGTVSGTAVYTITPISGASCIGPSTLATITVNPKPDNANAVIVNRDVICSGETVIVTIQSADPGINYEILDGGNNVISNIGSVAGESDLNITTYAMSTSTLIQVRATNPSSGCVTLLTNTVNVSVSAIDIEANVASTPICEDDVAGINLNAITIDPGIGPVIYSWTGPAGYTSGVADPLAFNSSSPNWPGAGLHTYTLTITDDSGNGCVFVSDVDVTIDEVVTADAGTGGDICGLSYLLNATPSVGTGIWTQQAGPGTSNFNNPNSPNATVTVDNYGTYTYRWTETNGACSDFAEIVVNFYETPVADAGIDGEVCGKDAGNPFTLDGNPSVGIGTWTQQSGPGSSSITDPSAATTDVSIDTYGTYIFRWTEANGVCSDFDEVTVIFNENPSLANAGSDIDQCSTSIFTMAADVPTVGTGIWSKVSGPGVITNPSSPATTVTGVTAGDGSIPTVLQWTVSNGSCPANTDQVSLINYSAPTASNAGVDQEQCGSGNFTLGGNAPASGTGLWSVVGAANGAVISTPTANNSTVTGLLSGSSVTLRWTISNGVCTDSFDEVVLTNSAAPDAAVAGTDQEQCATGTFTLGATPVTTGTGIWSKVSGPGVITNPSSPATTVTGVTAGDGSIPTVLQWTVSNGSCPANTDQVSLINYSAPTASNAGADQEQCGSGNFTLGGNAPASGTGLWSVVGAANGAVISTPTANNSTVTGLLSGSSVTLRWTISNGVCTDSFDEVVLTNSAAPDAAVAGTDQEQCATGTFTLGATPVTTGTGIWSKVSGPGVITNPSSPATTVTGVTAGDGSVPTVLQWTVSNGSCPANTDQVSLINYSAPTASNAGVDQEQCGSGNFTMAGNAPASGTGLWSVVGAANGAVITTPAANNSTVTGLLSGSSVTLRWTISNGVCTDSFDEVVLTNSAAPDAAVAGTDQEQCASNIFILAATPVTTGTGIWSKISGPGVITNPSSPATTVTGVTAGDGSVPTVLQWTVSNGSCPANTDQVSLINYSAPTASNAGVDQEQCGSGNFTMAGNAPASGTGLWSVVGAANGAVITTPAANNSTVTGLLSGSSVTLRWTISNGVCTDSFDEVVLTNSAAPDAAVAGTDQEQCATGTFTLGATPVTTGTGIWSKVSGPGVITNPSSPATTVTGVTAGDGSVPTVLQWTVSNGSCPANTDQVSLINYSAPTASNAGVNQEQCSSGNFTLGGNAPASGTGLWSVVGAANGAVITTPAANNSTVTGLLSGSSVTLRWTISNGVCTDSFDEVVLTNSAAPDAAVAGTDQEQCASNIFILAATPVTTGTGIWSKISGPGVITNPSSPATTVTGVTAGDGSVPTVLQWTVSNGSCAANTDQVSLINYTTPTLADAGPDQQQCVLGDFIMAANTPTSGTGLWSIVGASNGATITNPADPLTLITGLLEESSITLRWTISNGMCADSFDEVELTNSSSADAAVAGIDQEQCETSTFTLGATPVGSGTGTWSLVSGPGVITNPGSPTTTVTGVTAGDGSVPTILEWTVSNSTCPNNTDQVSLTNYLAPTEATAGSDQEQCNFGDFSLTGNIPTSGTGLWSIVGPANGAIITIPSDPGSTVTGLIAGFTATLRWSITNGACPASFDEVVLTNNALVDPAVAGPDQEQCASSIFTMAATPVTIGTGTWSIVSGPGVITNPASPTTTVTGVTAGDGSMQTILQWTVSNGSCVPNTDQVSLINYTAPSIANAGPDQEQCDLANFTLTGNVPSSGSGLWSIVGSANGAVITSPTDPASTVTGLTAGSNVTLGWTISHGVCTDSYDEVVLNNYLTPTMSINNVTTDICEGILTNITLLSTVPDALIRLVNVDYSSGNVSGGSLTGGETFTTGQRIRETLFTITNDIETVTYEFEVEANGCGPIGGFSTTVDVKPIPELTIVNHLPVICNDSTTDVELTALVGGASIDLISVTPSDLGAVGGYTMPGGPTYVPGDRIQDNLTNTSSAQQSIIYTFRIDANGCTNPLDKSVVVTINPTPIISVSGVDICSGDVTAISITNVNSVPYTTYDWILQVLNPNISGASAGSGSTIAQVLTNSNTTEESVTYRIIPSTIGCPGNFVDYVQVVSPGNTVDAGEDVQACENTGNVSIVDASIGGGATTSTWTVVNGSGTILDPNNIIAEYQPVPDEVGTVTLQLTASDPSTCPDVIDFVDIDIFPEAIVEAGPDDVICEGENYLLAGASRSGSANSIAWTTSGSGTFLPNPNTLNATYVPNTSDVGNAIRLYIQSNDPPGPCVPVIDSMELVINMAPLVSAGADKVICETDSIQLSDASFGGSATSITWSGGAGTFYPDPNTLNAWYVPAPSEVGSSVVLTITTNDNDGAGPCNAVSDQVQITINRAPVVSAGIDQVICEGSNVALNGTLGGGAISGTWSGGLGSFSDNTSLFATYIPDPSEAGTIVTLRLTTNDPSGPCNAIFDEMQVTINVAPVVDAGLDDEICIGDTLYLSGYISGSATLATWSGGVGTFSDVNDLNAYYLPDNTERGSQVILTLTTNDPDGSGPCPVAEDRVFETIHALPNPFFTGLDPQTAINSPPLPLQGFPPGGFFYGDGIATGSNEFNPILAGVGQKYVYYDYTDLNGCSNTYLDSILVNPTPDIDFGIDPAVCENADQIPLMATPSGGTFEGTGVTAIGGGAYIFDPDVAGVGEHIISYAFTDPETGATDTAFQQVRVLAVPVPDFSIDSFTCVDSLIQFTDQSTIDPSSQIAARLWKFGDGSEDTASNPQYQFEAAGIYFATLRVFSQPVLSTTCTDITSLVEIRVGGRPDVKMAASNFVMGDITQFTDLTTFPDGIPDDAVTTWDWDFDDGNFGAGPNPTHVYGADGKYTVYLDVQSTRGCVDRDSLRIAIIPVVTAIDPDVGWEDDFEYLDNWVAEPIEDTLNSWHVGQPNGQVINTASSGQNAWVTNLTGTYNNEETSWLKSPAFDLTGLTKPMVQFDYWSDMNPTSDGVTMEYSVDGGANWYLIGNKEGTGGVQWFGINWFDGERLFNVFGTSEGLLDNPNKVGWTEPTNGWETARIYLDPIIERHGYGDPVIFRFTLKAGKTSIGDNKQFEGFAMDNFVLKNRTKNVLVEQFVDFSGGTPPQYFLRNDMYPFIYDTLTYSDPQRNTSDVIYLEIHNRTNNGKGDTLYKDTPEIGDARSLYYGFDQTNSSYRRTIADGLFRGQENLIPKNDILKRALLDPKFKMEMILDKGLNLHDPTSVNIEVMLTANENLDEDMRLYFVILEDYYDKFVLKDLQVINILRNLGRQMVSPPGTNEPPTAGISLPKQWTAGQIANYEFEADLFGYAAGNPEQFKVIVFVQNINGEVFQAIIEDMQNSKEPPVGLEDEITRNELKQLNIYPQPAQHYAIVDFGMELSQDYNWEIIDQRGVTIGRGRVPKGEKGFEINTGLLPNGIHFLLIGDGEGLKMHRKLTIIH